MLWANSADDKLMIFFLFFIENRIWNFMQIVSLGGCVKSYFQGKTSLWKFLPSMQSVNWKLKEFDWSRYTWYLFCHFLTRETTFVFLLLSCMVSPIWKNFKKLALNVSLQGGFCFLAFGIFNWKKHFLYSTRKSWNSHKISCSTMITFLKQWKVGHVTELSWRPITRQLKYTNKVFFLTDV